MGIKKGDRERLRGKKEREGERERLRKNDLGYLKSYGSVLKDIWLSSTNLPEKTW